jgi:tetratricopeptide (TPR) repeat protein
MPPKYYESEAGILFVMGIIFRIDSVEKHSDGIWNIKLYLMDEEVKGFKELKNYYMTHEFGDSITTPLPFANLLRGMGDFDKAEEYYKLAIDELPSSHEDVPLVYNNLGLLYLDKNMSARAIEYCKKALELAHKRLPPYHITLARIYDSLAIIMLQTGDTSTAREYLDRASTIKLSSDHPLLPTIQDHRGDIAIVDGDLSSALDFYRIAQDMRQPPAMPDTHPDRAQSYVNIGRVFESQKKYKTALQNYQAAYDIFNKSLLPTSPRLVELKEAIECMKQKGDK